MTTPHSRLKIKLDLDNQSSYIHITSFAFRGLRERQRGFIYFGINPLPLFISTLFLMEIKMSNSSTITKIQYKLYEVEDILNRLKYNNKKLDDFTQILADAVYTLNAAVFLLVDELPRDNEYD